MDWGHYLFGFHGRINRAKIWLFVLIVIGVEIVAMILFSLLFGASMMGILTAGSHPASLLAGGAMAILGTILLLVICVVLIVAGFAVAVKRLHDRDKSAIWLLVFYVLPFVLNIIGFSIALSAREADTSNPLGTVFSLAAFGISVWAFVELYCLRGTVGNNRFGPDPLAGQA